MLYPSRKILPMVRFAFMSLPQLIASGDRILTCAWLRIQM